ncbi:unnamed protein product [Ilex paraguariensis]|uniref:Molybdate-anion transporter n=1 Tax=Ilex paraguariensis TaxID=185542 RepID=A0ABC8RNZ6_9AQUA
MEFFYYMVFGALGVVVAAVELSKSNKDRINTPQAFNSFKNNYILVYSLMMAGDWLQGPYVYYLYTTYGFGKGEIGQLFIAGFGSSMLFGTIVGSLADKQGRKRACVTYCITYILSCITKHSPQYKVLMLGRVLGGIATSLLCSAFESWLVAEHNKRGFDQQWLSITFSKAIFIGNGLVAIVSGLFGNLLVDTLSLGPVSPFDAASCFLAIGMAVILSSWSENYGDPSESKDLLTQFKGAAVAIASDEKIALLGAIQSLFEGSMYTFVFLWTPALSPNEEDIPHGFIFATFMLASMLGSSVASRLMARTSPRVESYMQIVFVVSAATLLLPIVTSFLVAPSKVKGGSISFAGCIQLMGFCTFEACVGIFWPSIMKMRSQYIPEEARSTIMNFFRIPLNIFVCVVLYNRGFDQQWLSITFSKAIFIGNGLVAIVSGLFGNLLVDTLSLGPVSPFDAASCFLAIGMAVILSSWSENYGDPSESKDLLTQFKGAAVAIASGIRGFDQQWLSITFSKAIFIGNGLVAIVSGLFGNLLVDTLSLGPVSPFDAASCFLAIGMAVILSSWSENYGDPSESKDLLTQFKGAAVAIASDEKIALLGAIQSLFEGSMYTFVFLWTPALSPNEEDIPHGFIFATFMLASMLGSSVASRLMARTSPRVESYMQIVFVVSAATLLLPIVTSFLVAPSKVKGGSISFAGCIQLMGFCTFEACVGIFWPSIMKMRSQYIPEEARSTIMNFFRIPLNIFVCVVLYNRRLLVIADKSKTEDWTASKEKDPEAEPLNND